MFKIYFCVYIHICVVVIGPPGELSSGTLSNSFEIALELLEWIRLPGQ